MVQLFANNGDPDQTPQNVASDLALRCLPITLLGVSRLQRVKKVGIKTGQLSVSIMPLAGMSCQVSGA